jgi:hypothetical protein
MRGTPPIPPRRNISAPSTVPPSRAPPAKPGRLKRWFVTHPAIAAVIVAGLVIVPGLALAAALIRQDVTTNPAAVAPDVLFEQGTDYAAINAAGFATLTLGSSGTSATLALSGVPGAALVDLSKVAKIHNQDATQAYTVTLSRSAAPNAAISSLQVIVKNGASTILTWDAATTATSGSFNLPAATTYDITTDIVINDGTAAGSLGSFGIHFSLVPV